MFLQILEKKPKKPINCGVKKIQDNIIIDRKAKNRHLQFF